MGGCGVLSGHEAHLSAPCKEMRRCVWASPGLISSGRTRAFSSTLPLSSLCSRPGREFLRTQRGERKELPVTACLATSNACQTKSRAVRGRGATIPRPSFTNYAEYLLTGGLSPRLLSRPHPPPQHPITSSPASVASLPGIAERKLLLRSPGGASGGDKGKGARRGEAGRRKVGARALISGKHFRRDDEKVIGVQVKELEHGRSRAVLRDLHHRECWEAQRGRCCHWRTSANGPVKPV